MNPTVSQEFPAVALSEEDRASYEALRLTEEEAKSLIHVIAKPAQS